MPRVGMAPGRVMSSWGIDAVCCCGSWVFEGLLDLLLELVEADAEGFLGFGRGGFQPGFADELEAPLFAA